MQAVISVKLLEILVIRSFPEFLSTCFLGQGPSRQAKQEHRCDSPFHLGLKGAL